MEFKRGCIKAFIEFVNNETKHLPRWKNGMYREVKRGYGNYLYTQYREMFLNNLRETLKGNLDNGFDYEKWLK